MININFLRLFILFFLLILSISNSNETDGSVEPNNNIKKNCEYSLQWYEDHPGYKGEFKRVLKYCKNYEQLLNEDIQVLFVSMTNDMASKVVIAGLKKGLHVFCEKPPGRNINEVKEVIIEEEKNTSLKLMYGFNNRLHDSIKDALNISNRLAPPNFINLPLKPITKNES